MRIASFVAIVFVAATSLFAQQPQFLIESIRVEGVRFGSQTVVASESRLVAGHAYSEPQLRDALARIQRLPFVLHADLALRRGSARDHYVLVVTVEEMKPLFVDYGVLSEAIGGWPRGVFTKSDVYRHREEYPNVGGRLFLGSHSMVLLTVDGHGDNNLVLDPVYGVSFTQYDLFGTHAVASASVRYRERSLDLTGFGVEGRTGLRFGDHLLWDVDLAVPISDNQALRAEWDRAYGETTTGPDDASRVTQFHGDGVALSWIYNTTNDLLFPTRGTYAEVRPQAQSRIQVVPVPGAIRTSKLATSWAKSVDAQVTHYFPITPVQALIVSGDVLTIDSAADVYRVRAGYTATRQLTFGRGGWAALHLEGDVERIMPRGETNLTAGVAVRNAWGVVHFDFSYLNWRAQSP